MTTPTAAFAHPPVYSPWFTFATQAPREPGVYEVDGPGLGSGPLFSLWDGCAFGILARSREAAAEARYLRLFAVASRTAPLPPMVGASRWPVPRHWRAV